MIVRKFSNGVIKQILGINPDEEDTFITDNPNLGVIKIDSLPRSESYPNETNYKWDDATSSVVVDDDANALDVQKANNIYYRQYLAETDWYVARKSENGTAIPDDIIAKRQEARDAIIE